MPSAFLRTCQTAWPLYRDLGGQAGSARVVVHPEIFESGGVYTAAADNNTGLLHRIAPGDSLSADQIRRRFPGFETDLLPAAGPWFTGGYEPRALAAGRAGRVAAWLQSEELRAELSGGLAVRFPPTASSAPSHARILATPTPTVLTRLLWIPEHT